MAAPPTPLPDDLASPRAIVLYATMFGATEAVAERVAELLSAELGYQVPCRDVAWYELAQLSKYDLLVIGSSTWNIGQLPSDLELHLPDLAELDLHGKLSSANGPRTVTTSSTRAPSRTANCSVWALMRTTSPSSPLSAWRPG